MSAPATVYTVVDRLDPATGEPAESDTDTSVSDFCPVARQIAKNLLNHLDDEPPGWSKPATHPTE